MNKRNTSGITGVTWKSHINKWCAQMKVGKNPMYLGVYKTKLDAAKARWKAEVKYGFPNCNTTSSALQYIKKHEPDYAA